MNLIIVESPTKAKSISGFLGPKYTVRSSFGHIRDLPRTVLGVDVENNFEPKYVIPPKNKKTISELKKIAEKSESVILATDPDREGEAIAWHLSQTLGLKDPKRIVFHEITKGAIQKAIDHPGKINDDLVNAQQARRVLDRLVGYKLSPFLWKKVAKGLSAGRVQSVALRLIVEREREIEAFKAQEYWSIEARLRQGFGEQSKKEFIAYLNKINGKQVDKFEFKNEKEAKEIVKALENAKYVVSKVEKKESAKNPLPPFITSTLAQEAARKLRFSTKQTMVIAQQLYEGIELGKGNRVGLITYMRTDSVNLSESSLERAKETIEKKFGSQYSLKSPRRYKTKSKVAQEAHEAIRPTDSNLIPEEIKNYLEPNQFKLYDLIWRRFIATQMPQAVFDTVSAEIQAGNYEFSAQGQTIKFDGFLKCYPMKITEVELPPLKEKEELGLLELAPIQHFTKPPAAYSEPSLIKTLEANNIGRPSTYAPIISTIQERNYVFKDSNRFFRPTEIGKMVNDILVEHFPEIVDIKFTSHMEDDLDEIANGKAEWVPIIKSFYGPFEKNLEKKYQEVASKKEVEETEEICEKCGGKMVVRMSRFGKFLACSNFPKCKNTKPLIK